jgi:hypothetical protein
VLVCDISVGINVGLKPEFQVNDSPKDRCKYQRLCSVKFPLSETLEGACAAADDNISLISGPRSISHSTSGIKVGARHAQVMGVER